MEMYQIIMVIFGGMTLLGSGAAVAMSCVIKFNDMQHLSSDVNELTKIVKENIIEQKKIGERVANIEGRCSSNHK